MAVALQERYSALVDAKLRYEITQKNGLVWNTKYEGDPKAGAVKVPVRDTEATVAAYDKANGATKTSATGSFATITIDKDYAVNEVIDNYDAASVPDNIVADRLDSAGYGLALQMNSDGTAALVAGGSVITGEGDTPDTTAISKTNVYDYMADAKTALTKKKIPTRGRFMLISPDVENKVIKSAEFISASNLGDEVKQSGVIGQIAGFNVIVDATLPENVDFIAGHPDWCCRVEEWAVEPRVQSLDGSGDYIGASAVQGRKIYAHKVTKAAAVLIKKNA